MAGQQAANRVLLALLALLCLYLLVAVWRLDARMAGGTLPPPPPNGGRDTLDGIAEELERLRIMVKVRWLCPHLLCPRLWKCVRPPT